jgi:hypothetical protein
MATSASRNGGFDIGIEGLEESLAVLTRAGANVRGLQTGAVYQANSFLRARAGRLGDRVARTTIVPLLLSGPAPQSAAMSATVRSKIDRKVIIRVGATNPKLRGWRRGAENRRYRGSVAWGIERGGFPGSNYYNLPRRESGYVIGPNMELIQRRILPEYRELVRAALSEAGVTSWGRAV